MREGHTEMAGISPTSLKALTGLHGVGDGGPIYRFSDLLTITGEFGEGTPEPMKYANIVSYGQLV